MISLESCGSGNESDSACCHTQMYGGYPTLLLAVQEAGPWEDDAYFITKGSTLSVKRAELHCAVIGNWLLQCLSRFKAFWPTALRFFFLIFFFIQTLTVTLLSAWGLVKISQLRMKDRLLAVSTAAF